MNLFQPSTFFVDDISSFFFFLSFSLGSGYRIPLLHLLMNHLKILIQFL